ncbi:putative hydrolase YutF [Jeotgalicoccus meleagridis]|uniref:Acid sugar phosphatase n=2 Tax=Jeotgalicoccus meleagridis TaxID=2759181 RepID=A0A6V7RQB5_9STAP|nr:putative hydrolase YutF [Jeotgalicoccus meleagridis]
MPLCPTMYKGYLIDLDGTMFNGDEVIEGAVDFINRLNAANIPYLFLTNNATRNRDQLLEKFHRLGFNTTEGHIYTAAMTMADYIDKRHKKANVYVVGTPSFKQTISTVANLADKDVDIVVMGLDPEISYQKLREAGHFIQNGAEFLATNPDIKIKSSEGFIPGNGAFVNLVSQVTGVKPTFVGKPEKYILEGALERLGLNKDEVVLVGDNYDTDILTGINGEVKTIHVNTGVHSTEYVSLQTKKPDHLVENLSEWKI